jgi:hypothetical protein
MIELCQIAILVWLIWLIAGSLLLGIVGLFLRKSTREHHGMHHPISCLFSFICRIVGFFVLLTAGAFSTLF